MNRKRRRKAMGVGMVFGIIFAIVVIGMIMIFGSDAINSIFCMGNDAQMQKTIKNMQNFVDELYTHPSGSGDYFIVNIPGGFWLCFMNSTNPSPVFYPEQHKTWNPDRVYQRIIKDEGYSIWYNKCSGESGGKINHFFISPEKNFCVKSGTELYFENMGRWVTILDD
jgi:hypothetical protein